MTDEVRAWVEGARREAAMAQARAFAAEQEAALAREEAEEARAERDRANAAALAAKRVAEELRVELQEALRQTDASRMSRRARIEDTPVGLHSLDGLARPRWG